MWSEDVILMILNGVKETLYITLHLVSNRLYLILPGRFPLGDQRHIPES